MPDSKRTARLGRYERASKPMATGTLEATGPASLAPVVRHRPAIQVDGRQSAHPAPLWAMASGERGQWPTTVARRRSGLEGILATSDREQPDDKRQRGNEPLVRGRKRFATSRRQSQVSGATK